MTVEELFGDSYKHLKYNPEDSSEHLKISSVLKGKFRKQTYVEYSTAKKSQTTLEANRSI
jgi:hypothetical protein